MPTAPQAKPTFDLKSTAWTLTALRLHTADLGLLVAALDARFGDNPGLFDNDPLVIDLSPLRDADTEFDIAGLLPHLRRHLLAPIAAQGGSDAQMAAARSAGLAEALDAAPAEAATARSAAPAAVNAPDSPSSPHAPNAPHAPNPPNATSAPLAPARDRVVREPVARRFTGADAEPIDGLREVVRAVEVVREVPTAAVPTMVIDKPLRSGQRVYARGGDLVVLAVVSFGAEVIADGNIHVYAPLRGRAIAGARGNTDARIFSTCLEAQLVSIAGIYRTTETPLPATVLGQPAQIWLDGEKIMVEPLTS